MYLESPREREEYVELDILVWVSRWVAQDIKLILHSDQKLGAAKAYLSSRRPPLLSYFPQFFLKKKRDKQHVEITMITS